MGDILQNTTDYDAVRQALGVDDRVVDDTLVTSMRFLEYVESQVKELIQTWAAILGGGGTPALELKLGTANWTASRLAWWMQRQEAQNFKIGSYSQNASAMDWEETAKRLAEEAAKDLGDLTGFDKPERVTLLTVTGPTRSGSNVPSTFNEWVQKITPDVIEWLESN